MQIKVSGVKSRWIEALIALSSFFISVVFIRLSLLRISSEEPVVSLYYSREITAGMAAGFSLAIIFGWLGFGIVGGGLFLGLSTLITLIVSANLGDAEILLQIPLFFAVWGMVFFLFKRINAVRCREQWKIDELEEKKNSLLAEVEAESSLTKGFQRRIQKYSSLKRVTQELNSTLSLEDVTRLITEKAMDIVGKSDASFLFLVDEEKQKLRLTSSRYSSGTIRDEAKEGDAFDRWVLKHRQPLIVDDLKKDFRFNLSDDNDYLKRVRSLICAPMFSFHKMFGMLRLDNRSKKIYGQEDLRLLDVIAGLGAVSIQNALLYQRTWELAITDGLTGLYLQRYFYQRLDEELKRCLRKNVPFSILIMDIDDFKKYNDKYGHIAGDKVLRRIAERIKSVINGGDVAARYGGEEFAIILPEESKEKASGIAEKLRTEIANEDIVIRRLNTNVTVSIGMASFPEDAAAADELVQRADTRLYEAKRQGKNRIVMRDA